MIMNQSQLTNPKDLNLYYYLKLPERAPGPGPGPGPALERHESWHAGAEFELEPDARFRARYAAAADIFLAASASCGGLSGRCLSVCVLAGRAAGREQAALGEMAA